MAGQPRGNISLDGVFCRNQRDSKLKAEEWNRSRENKSDKSRGSGQSPGEALAEIHRKKPASSHAG